AAGVGSLGGGSGPCVDQTGLAVQSPSPKPTTATRGTCTAALNPLDARRAVGTLSGHPARPTVRLERIGDVLDILVLVGDRPIGHGALRPDAGDYLEGLPPWAGEVLVDGCKWWCTSPRGSGILTFANPRTPSGGA
ncbi:MAG TPA: hypothetical protein VJK90_08015, partial [Acetobacteraceae bacterium]|nr:hypothetical protein [Acetobacteraceae bacterium]